MRIGDDRDVPVLHPLGGEEDASSITNSHSYSLEASSRRTSTLDIYSTFGGGFRGNHNRKRDLWLWDRLAIRGKKLKKTIATQAFHAPGNLPVHIPRQRITP